ncbi:MAG: outer membrane lipoprotein carrier protein LolA [Bacteroidales bacterium]|nr:outer membrane lipoprotein carrier protein LolA [Bacteroidales bacterium]
MHRLFLFVLLASSFMAGAQQKPLDAATIQQIKKGVSQASAKTNTISSEFTQEKEMRILNDKIISSGRFYFKKDRLLRWEYIHPFSYVIAIRGDVITIQDEGEVKSFNTQSNKVFSEVNRIIIGSVNGTLLEDDSFKASYIQNRDHYVVSLTPVSPSLRESLSRIMIFFNKTNFTVDKLEMYESEGDFTRIAFTTKELNKPVSDEVFILN